MAVHLTDPGDTIRIKAVDVKDVSGDLITSGLAATAELVGWESAANVDGPDAMSHDTDNPGTWYVDMTAPVSGTYGVIIEMSKAGVSKTIRGQLKVTVNVA